VSTWELIEQAIMAQPVALPLSRRELYVVKEAHAAWVRRTLDEASAWDVLENIKILMESDVDEGFFDMFKGKQQSPPAKQSPEMTTAVKGLDAREVNLIRQFKGNAKSKTGETGEIVALSPKEWMKIKQELEKQPEYYDKLLGNIVSADGLAKKIQSKLDLTMGKGGPSKLVSPDPKPDPSLGGNPADPTDVQTGAAMYGNDVPLKGPAAGAPPRPVTSAGPESPEARKRRVAAQDMQSMGAKNKDELDNITGSGKVKV